jgi:hypothetical protein
MRKFIGLLVAAAFLWVAAAPAQAVALHPGENYAKLIDYTSFYVGGAPMPIPTNPNGTVNWSLFSPAGLVGAELRAIFKVTDLSNEWNPAAPAYWTEVATDGSALTGLMYDLIVHTVTVTATGFEAYLVPGAGSKDAGTVAGAGGQLDVWVDTTPDFSQAAGPGAWLTDGTNDDYPTASDIDGGGGADAGVSQWLRADFVPEGIIPGSGGVPFVYLVTVSFNTLRGQGNGFADVFVNNTGLPIAGSVDFPDALSPVNGGDLSILTNLTLAGTTTVFSGWQVQSNDPVEFYALPEPASMSLLLVGLFGGAGAYWRRRRAA